jgi:hypothetical protein
MNVREYHFAAAGNVIARRISVAAILLAVTLLALMLSRSVIAAQMPPRDVSVAHAPATILSPAPAVETGRSNHLDRE